MRIPLFRLTVGCSAVLAVGASGCTSDLRAPSNYLVSDDSSDETAAEMLMVDCGEPPVTAVGADYSHTVTANGGDGNYTFTFVAPDDVPAGLVIDSGSGEITGPAEVEADAVDVIVEVTDGAGATGEATCTLDINPRLSVDLAVEAPGCLSGTQSLRDVVIDGTGDGTPIVCDGPGGRGNGRTPDGHSVGAETCQIEGTFQDEKFGTWVFMMRGTQSGVEVFVPFCVTNDDPGDFYDVRVLDEDGNNVTLEPYIGTFNPDASFALGMPGERHFEVEDADSCGDNSCNFGFNYLVTATNFNDNDLSALVTGDQLLRNMADEPVGMQHDLVRFEGSDIMDDFRDRPWITSFAFSYCLSATAADCTGGAITDNAGALFEWAVLMFPEGT